MKKNSIPLILMIVSIAAAVISAAVRIVLTLTQFDAAYGLYEHGAVLPTVHHIALALIVVALILLACRFAPKHRSDLLIPVKDVTVFISSLTAFMLAASTLLTIYNIVRGAKADLFTILEIVFAIPALIFFFGLIKKGAVRSNALAFASFGPIAWCAVCLIRVYFDNALLHTSPTKTFAELALLAAMICLLSESRFQLGIVSHRFYLASALCAPIFLLTDAIPGIILSGRLLIGSSVTLFHCVVEAVLALFIYARLAAYISVPDAEAVTE